MAGTRILVVDDELIIRESLSGWLERDGHEVHTAESGEEALSKIKETRYDIIFLDIKMDGMSGLEVLTQIRQSEPEIAVVMITAYGSISSAVKAMKDGAYDYLLKPFDPTQLELLIQKILERRAQARENLFLKEQYKEQSRFESMIGQSRKMREVFDLINDVAPTESTVLITGETGTGKGIAAKAIHTRSPRCAGPFVAINCGALPEHLLESELFGYQKGAFTDAKVTKSGRLEMAEGGTLFLDEIGEISVRMQIDLLRVLEDRIFYRVGGTQPIEADFRVIAATNRDIEDAMKEGRFRRDLFYRLNVISFKMPSLRERKEDIPLLVEHFLSRFSQETNKAVDKIDRDAMDELMLYDWPGNVRELENAIERAVVVCKGREITVRDLPIYHPEGARAEEPASLKEMEKAHISKILEMNDWNIVKSAKALDIDRSTLYAKISRYGLKREG